MKQFKEEPTHIHGVYITKFKQETKKTTPKVITQIEKSINIGGIAVDSNVSIIKQEIAELQKSIHHLQRSNREIKEFDPNLDDKDFKLAIEENIVVIQKKKARIEFLNKLLHPDLQEKKKPELIEL